MDVFIERLEITIQHISAGNARDPLLKNLTQLLSVARHIKNFQGRNAQGHWLQQ
jgi:hypothetical protein